MTVITIQCLLQAKEENLCYLWNLMIEKNTLLVSEILERIRTHRELDTWIAQGYIPVTAIDKIANQLKQQPKYSEMPGRFGTSAETLVKDIYKSWFAVQRKKRNKLWGKTRWLTIIKSEHELLKATKLRLSELQAEAKTILKREQKKYDKLNRIYFEARSFSSSGSRCFLTQRRLILPSTIYSQHLLNLIFSSV